MKKIINISLAAVLLLASAISASAQMKGQGDWKQKMMSEKIAFLTIELNITPEEAQKFWPVYNEVDKARDESMFNVFKAFKALEDGIAEKKDEKEIARLLDEYIKAQEKQREVEDNAADQYKKVLSVDKVAKLYVGEEKFRRQHIRRLHEGPGSRR